MTGLLGLLLGGASATQAAQCKTPRAWQPRQSNPSMDSNANHIHDVVESFHQDEVIEVVVNLNRCPTADDLVALGDFGTVKFRSKWLSFAILEGVVAGTVQELAQLGNVAFVEHSQRFVGNLNVSNPAIKVKPSIAYSPNTIADAYPTITGTGVNIAIIDSGVDDLMHESFDAKFVGGSDCRVDPCVDLNPPVSGGHGTWVAGIALGTGGSSGMNQGIARNAGLVDMNAIGGGTSDAIARAMERVLDNRTLWGVDVVNLSVGTCADTNGTDAFSELANRMVDEGLVVVASTANCSGCNLPANCRIVPAPAAADKVIAVGNASDLGTVSRADDSVNTNSAEGPRGTDGDADAEDELKPDLVAPGTAITSARDGTTSGYVESGGTSGAAPHVTGCAALLLQQNPDLRPLSLKRLLLSTAEDRGPAGWDKDWGRGLLDCHAALDEMNAALGQTDLRYDDACGGTGQPPCWLHPSLFPANEQVIEGIPNTIHADIFNGGPNAAADFEVRLSVYNFSNEDLTYDICTVPVDGLAPGQTLSISCAWTPELSGTFPGVVHACLKAEIVYPRDTVFANNFAQHNINVLLTSSPASFRMEVDNKSDVPLTMDVRETFDCPGAECFGWQFTASADLFPMQPDDCPRQVELLLEPVDPSAVREARVRVGIVGIPPAGPEVEQGGVAVEARIGCLTRGLRAVSDIAFQFDADRFFRNCPPVFDVARGALPILPYPSLTPRGDFTAATCIADDVPSTEFVDATEPDAGAGFYYLTRAGGPVPGSWESGSSSQVGHRNDTLHACP
jgi:hypothetical protein